jgi:hypothetical protein
MKRFKKLIFLPLFGLVLTGCNKGTPSTSTPGTSNAPTSVSKEVAATRINAAFVKMLTTTVNSIEVTAKGDLNIATEAEVEPEFVDIYGETSSSTAEVAFDAHLVANNLQDLDIEKVEAKADVALTVKTEQDADVHYSTEGLLSGVAFVKEGMLYLDLNSTYKDDEGEQTSTEKGKVALVDIFEGLEIPSEIPSEVPTSLPTETIQEFANKLALVLDNATEIEAYDTAGDLRVSYTIDNESLLMGLVSFYEQFVTDEPLTQEAIDNAREMMNEVLQINKAVVTVGVSKDGYFNHFSVDADIEFSQINSDYDYYTNEYVMLWVTHYNVVANFSIDFTLNGNPTITFPGDLATFPDFYSAEAV